jgi:hypothetical protein
MPIYKGHNAQLVEHTYKGGTHMDFEKENNVEQRESLILKQT